jgi:two-component system, chemotaxis family, CheB/CheR fusion protein
MDDSEDGFARPPVQPVPPAEAPTRIVGIGASAGGLESLEQLFAEMPADTGMAFVVVQHLSPDFRSLMDELIARHSDMPVGLAEDGVLVEPNHIYLMPPKKEMIIRDRRLILTDKDPAQGLSLPIDQFFRSLAQDQGPQAVGVVLSGSGSDGSRGIIDIKRAGGMVLAESVASAKFDGMPLSAQATGVVDDARLPRDLARILCGLPPLEVADDAEPLSEDPAMDAALRLLRDQLGIDFSLYKTSTVARRIQRRADLLRVDSIAAYVAQLRLDPDELNALYQDLLIGVTQFFRDPEAFETLEREVIPQILERVPPAQELRLWCAGCATGEEAYSIAMLFHEALTARGRPINLKILATDVHPMSLDFASAGIYGDAQLAHVAPNRLERFFTRRTSGYQISPDLRQLIVFARHNVLKDAPFTKLSFISCRNMLIYLQPQAQRTVLSLFHFGLASGGVLFLGASESPGALSDEFTSIDDHWKIYRKRRDVHLLAQIKLPLGRRNVRRTPVPIDLPRATGADPLILATYDQLLDEFMPPSFLVDEERCLVDSFGGAERLLRVRRRRMSTSILDLLEGELRTVVAGGIQRAIKEQARVEYTGVRIPDGDGERRCTMSIRPLLHPRTGARHLLISFGSAPRLAEPSAPDAAAAVAVASVAADQVSQERMSTLETELAYTKETLQATIEELETSNEEMQATNEELVASNEELQSTNEELHSVNEELYSVNAEYQQKIAELKELNADIRHLLDGTDVGTLFLDRDLRIRRFTPRIASVFHIVEHDLGRQIGDFSHNIERRGLMEDIERVRRDGEMLEAPVRDQGGTPYFLRILPYHVAAAARDGDAGRRGEGAPIEGVVLTLTDITALDKARSKLAQLSAIVESCDDAIVGKALDGTITSWNRGAERLYGYAAEEAIGQNVRMLMPESSGELERYLDMIRRGEKVEHVQSVRVRKDGSRLEVSLTISPIWDHDGELVGVSAIARDVTPLVVAQRELELAARRREQFLAMLSHELRNPLAAVLSATHLMEAAQFEGATIRKCHHVIGRQASHMARLLDDLLDVSRITHGKFELRKQDLDLRGPIEAAIESASPLVAERRIDLRIELPDEPVLVRGDGSRLQQVVVNLLSNAVLYSPAGAAVELRLAREADRAVLEVADRGIGIAPEMLGKIFELFVQAEQRIDRPRGGLGVGLSLARSVIELHGGTIEAFSDGPGQGSRFVVRLPLQAHAIRGRAVSLDRTLRQYRVVVVEDNADSREMLRVLLEQRKHVVLEAADGAQGLELIEREHPDAALVDIGLPVLSGFEVARRIRDKKHLDDVVLVALTGYGAPADVAASRDAGFDYHLCKPAELARIEALLDRARLDRDD